MSAALHRWLEALHGFGAEEPVRAALAPDGQVLRHGWDERRGRVLETFTGPAEVAGWCGRSPRTVRFAVVEGPTPDGQEQLARYRVSIGDYENGGTWRFHLAPDGRLQRLEHQPDDLPAQWREGIPPGKSLGLPPSADVPHAHDHAHGHAHGHDER